MRGYAWMLTQACVLACSLNGCALQLAGGAQALQTRAPTFEVGGRFVGTRRSGAFAGADLVASVPRNGTMGLRQVLLTGGYRHLFAPWSLELGADLGAGQPASVLWNGTGTYLGASSTWMYRLAGHQDSELGFLPGGYLVDAMLVARGGVWSRPEGDTRAERAEACVLLGVRFTGISDIVVSDNENWRP